VPFMISENVKWWHGADNHLAVVVQLPAHGTMDVSRNWRRLQLINSGESSGTWSSIKEVLLHCHSCDLFAPLSYYDAVDAQKLATARFWERTVTAESVVKDVVANKCIHCSHKYSAWNPSATMKGHFVKREHWLWACKNMIHAHCVRENDEREEI
jgi:hypothetical protein